MVVFTAFFLFRIKDAIKLSWHTINAEYCLRFWMRYSNQKETKVNETIAQLDSKLIKVSFLTESEEYMANIGFYFLYKSQWQSQLQQKVCFLQLWIPMVRLRHEYVCKIFLPQAEFQSKYGSIPVTAAKFLKAL